MVSIYKIKNQIVKNKKLIKYLPKKDEMELCCYNKIKVANNIL
jgi:hypothetical protein